MDAKVRRQLESIDWDFRESLRGASKSIHWYPGSFTSSVPGTLIEALSQEGALVFDPYGGVGTTAVEAARLGRRAIVTETNGIGVLSAYISCGLVEALKERRSLLLSIIGGIRSLIINETNEDALFLNSSFSPELVNELDVLISKRIKPNLKFVFEKYFAVDPALDDMSKWFHPKTLEEISILREKLRLSSFGKFGSLVGLILLSSRLKALSSQTRSWGHIADNVYPKDLSYKSVSSEMKSALTSLLRSLGNLQSITVSKRRSWTSSIIDFNWMIDKNFSRKARSESDLMITSPPYANAIDYTKAQRLSLNLFGFSDTQISFISQTEVGARTRRFKSDSLDKWLFQVEGVLNQQLGNLSEKAAAVLVLPHKDERRSDGCAAYIESVERHGWKRVMTMHRSINELRTRQSWSSIKFEEIVILERV